MFEKEYYDENDLSKAASRLLKLILTTVIISGVLGVLTCYLFSLL